MMGSTHKAVGVVTGLILAICGVIYSEYIMIVMLFVVPVGAMLPDIDHNNSKLGRKRKKVVTLGQKFLSGASVGICVYGVVTSLMVSEYSTALLYILAAAVLLALFAFLPRSAWAKKQLKFFTKHRGIMHTLIVPGILMWLVVSTVTESTVRVVLTGLAVGYLTHLAGDCLTKEGCPILWPFTKKCISLLPITTNTRSEKFVAFLLCVVICVCAIVFYGTFSKIV